MKRFFLCIAFLFPVICLMAQQRGIKYIQVTVEGSNTTLYKQSHALLIGVCNYANGLPSLPGVQGDINAVKAALEKNGFDVTVVMNPDRAGLDKTYNDFIGKYGQDVDSRLLFYFAGHGYTKKMSYGDDLGFLLPSDAVDPNKNPNTFQSKALPMTLIETYALQIQSKHALFLFDACFSGAIFSPSRAVPEAITYKTTQQVRQFITSGSANETVPDQSIFRQQFIRALNGDGDLNKDGYMTGAELGEFLQTNVVNYSYNTQHPQYGKIRRQNLDQGDFVFVINSAPENPIIKKPQTVSTTIPDKITIDENGRDVLIHNEFILNSMYFCESNRLNVKYDSNLNLYLAFGDLCRPPFNRGNEWLSNLSEDVNKYKLFRKPNSDYWIAKDMVNVQFQIVQLINNESGANNRRWLNVPMIKNTYHGKDCDGMDGRHAFLVTNDN